MTPEFRAALPYLVIALIFFGVVISRLKWAWLDMEPGEFFETYRWQVVAALLVLGMFCLIVASVASVMQLR